jgi:colanic acid/amylovoran biosynthesis protein
LLASDHVRGAFAREAISLAVLSNLLPEAADKNKLQFCPDMAFYLSFQNEPSFPAVDLGAMPRPCLVLALRDWGFPNRKTSAAKKLDRENYLQGVIATCLDLYKKYNASFLIFNQVQGPSLDEDDRLVSDYVHHDLRTAIPSTHLRSIEPVMGVSPSTIIHMLRQADMVVTSRMHSAIFSFLAGTPVVVIGYQHKSLGILQSLKLEDCLLPIEQTCKETLLPLCEKVLKNRDEWRERITRVIPGIRETIEAKFRMFFYGAD